MAQKLKVSLIGNPNTGKTSLFNELTGLNQKVGNYPGVTVDKRQGTAKLDNDIVALVTDLPGTYSVNPTSLDESIVLKNLLKDNSEDLPDVIVVVADVENLKRNLLLFSQVQDFNIPVVLAINMADQMQKKGISINIQELEKELETKVILISVRTKEGINQLKSTIANFSDLKANTNFKSFCERIDSSYFASLKKISNRFSVYQLWLILTKNHDILLLSDEIEALKQFEKDVSLHKRYQHKETIYRYQKINEILKRTYSVNKEKASDLRSKLDRVFTHKFAGYAIFFALLLLIFQSIFDWASAPMDFIDELFAEIATYLKGVMPEGMFTDLLIEGIVPGIGGVVIFIPQIAILFLFIAILEETGYMSRVVFLMDKIMRRFGMNGKSVIPLISGTACAIPAVMATRTISSWKERLITILVTPFTTCSARLPVYAIIIALIIPEKKILGVFNLQGLTLLSLYILGFAVAVFAAFLLHKQLKIKNDSLFVVEMPDYNIPSFKNVFLEVFEKTKTFVFDAGKIILAISVILWFLASHGPSSFDNVEQIVSAQYPKNMISQEELDQKIAASKLENSYIGIMGKTIEPIVTPLGYDWKIGIGLITSFAAREVFIGTLATIYSVGNNDEDTTTIKEKMAMEINANTGKKRFNFATGVSLLLFYAFAMQCMATLAVVKRETKSWKWPLLQLVGMGVLAYLSALIFYQILR